MASMAVPDLTLFMALGQTSMLFRFEYYQRPEGLIRDLESKFRRFG